MVRRSFFYHTGVDFADCFVTYDIDKDSLVLWIPYVAARQTLWFGSTPNAEQAKKMYDVDDVQYSRDLPRFMRERLRSPTTVYTLHESQKPPVRASTAPT